MLFLVFYTVLIVIIAVCLLLLLLCAFFLGYIYAQIEGNPPSPPKKKNLKILYGYGTIAAK